ncbi:DUF1657 domain-containing protein [Bacillus sp. FJAT-45350]|uniref:DUF1657 domain-containing protein n=1 Tax=Bacillus sp. FJAT-45350 TaxID=2011014 RepID=UPI000BB7DA5F|nr:DUF1657 domain-containing protein [Bacillus sp. FJAT-45350]
MTVASQVKQCVSTLKGIEATLNSMALKAENDQAQQVFRDTCLITRRVIGEVENRVGDLEREEPQYKGF